MEEDRRHFSSLWYLGTLLEDVDDAVVALNPQRQIVYANPAFLDLAECDLASAAGKRPGELLGCEHAEETEGGCGTTTWCSVCGALKVTLASQRGRYRVRPWHLTLKGGEARELMVWASPLPDRGRQLTLLVVGNPQAGKRYLF